MGHDTDGAARDRRGVPRLKRPAIIFLVRSLDIGGAERQLVELATGLRRASWNVEVITFYGDGPLEPLLKTAGVPVRTLGKRGRWDIVCLWKLARYLRRNPPDILHGYLPLPNILVTMLRPLARTRVVWGVRASNMDLEHYDWLARVESRLAAALASRADLLISNSFTGRTFHVARGYPAEKTIVVPNGIDLGRFRPDEAARLELRRQWGIGSNECLIGLVARLDPMKDHVNFLRAAARVLQSRSNTRFVCVGDGPAGYRQKLEQTALSLGVANRLLWVDARSDVQRVYNALDLAVLSSAFGEGFPNVIAEAMATGVPCVVTNVGDAAAIVGDTGWVCPPRDSAALARKIIEGVDALPGDAAAIRARVSTQYGSHALIDRTEARFLALLGAGNASAIGAPDSSVSVARRDA